MKEEFIRTALLLGEENVENLAKKRVAVFGIGGVGGFVVEALARCGIGNLDLIDNDVVAKSNLNRQIVALNSTLGKLKVEVMKERVLDINPSCNVKVYKCFYLPENKSKFDFTLYDYVVDAIDTVTGKISLVLQAFESKTPIISAMGAGNKLDPTMLEVSDIYKTSVCPLARVMRNELKKHGIKNLKVVYSKERPIKPIDNNCTKINANSRKITPGSISFVPSVAGLIIAGEIIKDFTS
jgi:UBA/THIF-type NAD/FAD binding protein